MASLTGRLAATLAIGAIGGAAFTWFNLPLAWMLGAMVATAAASLGGAGLYIPSSLRSTMITIIGVLLGASFTPEIFEKIHQWPLTIAGLFLYLGLLIGVLFVYFHKIVGLDAPTAYFSAAPGGLSEMVVTGASMGADDRAIALIHASRILLVVLAIPFWFRFTTGVTTTSSDIGPSITAIVPSDIAVLITCAIVGAVMGRLIRLPAYRLSGPMLVSAIVHITGYTESTPPWEVVATAQVAIGSAVGARFSGVPMRRVLRLMAVSAASTILMLTTAVSFAFVLASRTGLDWQPIVLAYAPGGLAEMSLIALSLGIETAFVATHHIIRITLIVMVAPFVFTRIHRPDRCP